ARACQRRPPPAATAGDPRSAVRRSPRMTAALPVLFLLLAATSGAAAPAIRNPGGSPPAIVNGTFTAQYPSIGALLSPADPDRGGLVCSGTLIGCRTFLT